MFGSLTPEPPTDAATGLTEPLTVGDLTEAIRAAEQEWYGLPDDHPMHAPGKRHLWIAQSIIGRGV